MPQKTSCPITRAQFEKALPLTVKIGDGNQVVAGPKEFSTASLGWYASGKVVIEVDGVPCTAQLGMSLVLVGSKELPETPAAAPAKIAKK